MTVSEYIFDFLQKHGTDTVFMVSGSSAMWLTDALARNKQLKPICCHHEQAAAMAADGYGRLHTAPGACLVTVGPGATNAVTGVAQAYLDSSSMFIVSGEVNSRLLKYEMESGIRQNATQSLDIKPMASSVTKYFAIVWQPEDIRYHMERAYYEAMDGRRGPVWIDVPIDIQNKQIPAVSEMRGFKSVSDIGDDVDYDLIITQMQQAERPLIFAGGGVQSAGMAATVVKLAEVCQAPVVTSRGGIDVIPSSHPLFIGRPGSYGDRPSHCAVQEADFILILGSRLSVSTVGYYPQHFGGKAFKVKIDTDAKELAKNDVPIERKYCARLEQVLPNLLELAEKASMADHNAWLARLHGLCEHYPNVLPAYADEKPLNEYYFTRKLSEQAPNAATIVVDTGSVCNVVSQSWYLKAGQRYLISGGLSCMGFWATAIGAAADGRETIALAGDGSVQMNIQEFATLTYNKLPIKLFVYNNNGYMLIRHNQHNYMNDRFLGVGPDSGLQTPDFCKVAKAYGLPAMRITCDDDLDEVIQRALATSGPLVCEVMVQEFAPIVPRIASRVMPDGSLKAAEFDDLYPFLEEKP